MNNNEIVVPKWFWAIAIFAVLWNCMGVAVYLMDVLQTEADIAKLDQVTQGMYAMRPSWAIAAFALAVFSGLLGSILLLLRKELAAPVFLFSLVCIMTQNVFWFGIAKAHLKYQTASHTMSILVIIVAVALIWFSRSSRAKGWLR